MQKTQTHTDSYFIKQLPHAVAFVDKTLRIVYTSDRLLDQFGSNERHVEGKSLHEVFGTISNKWLKEIHASLHGKPARKGRELLLKSDGAQWLEWINTPWFDNEENIIGTIIQVEDITVQVIKENAIKEEAETLRTLIDHLPLNVYIKDMHSKKILANKSEVNYCGLQHEDEIIGKDDFDFLEEESAKKNRLEDIEVMTSLKPILGKEHIVSRKEEKPVTFLISKIPLRSKNGTVKGLVGYSLDISERKKKEEELQQLNALSGEQNKKLINFAHIVSHNIRSQSANFSMLLSFLADEKDEEERLKIIQMLTEASDHLLDTIDNLNDVVTINKTTETEKTTVIIKDELEEVTKNLNGFLMESEATIYSSIQEDSCIKGIPLFVKSILTNFITNAVKFKHNDRPPIIHIRTTKTPGSLMLSIEDNGLGIDLKKDGDKLFGMYKTFHESTEARGIGLFKAKNQIEAMGGRIKCTSELGKGTVFNLHFNEIC